MPNNLKENMLAWFTPKVEDKGIYIVPIADLHACSTTALFPYWLGEDLGHPLHENMLRNGDWRFKHADYSPKPKQYRMFKHFTKCAEIIAERRKGKKLVVIGNGDLVDGNHHHTQQIATANIREQTDVAVWLMEYFLAKIGFSKEAGDLLYIGAGTEAHDQDEEDSIAQRLGANKIDGEDVFDFLPMNIKGKEFWFMHQGASPGKGINKGNGMISWMKNKYFECLEDKRTPPDVIYSGHFHSPHHATWTHNYKTMHYILLPPFQLKTRFGHRVAGAELDKVGIHPSEITTDGQLIIDEPILLKEYPESVVIA